MTMVVMLCVIGMLVLNARDERNWRWLTNDPEGAEPPVEVAQAEPKEIAAAPSAPGPKSEPADDPAETFVPDEEEREALEEELQAVDDRGPLTAEEMPAYWRLLEWGRRQDLAALRKQARTDITFRELMQRPEHYRGQLMAVRVHLSQSATHTDIPPEVKAERIYEFWGWNESSQPYFYLLVTSQVPPGLPLRPKITEEATFVGYFLKLEGYENHLGKRNVAPLLIGRLVWHQPLAQARKPSTLDWIWPWALGGIAVLLVVLRLGTGLMPKKTRRTMLQLGPVPDENTAPVEDWLSGTGEGQEPPLDDDGRGDDGGDDDERWPEKRNGAVDWQRDN